MSPSDRPCRQGHIMRIETFDDILTDNRVITWDTTRARELVARRSVMEDESTGAVTVGDLKGDALANALMKAETKAKRRVTLSIAGLGWLDETELDPIPQSRPVVAPDQESPAAVHPTADHISSLIEMARACGVDARHAMALARATCRC